MPVFPPDEVLRLARLARLELTADEVELFARQLGDILEFARQVNEVDTAAVPVATAVMNADALRVDVVAGSLDRGDVLAGAPAADQAAGLFKVPRVLN